MPTIRSELSSKNPYHIHKDRYLELKHFCAQMPYIERRISELVTERYRKHFGVEDLRQVTYHDYVSRPVEAALPGSEEESLTRRLEIFNESFRDILSEYFADPLHDKTSYILYFQQAVEGSVSYDKLVAAHPDLVVFTREQWYEMYRKFFYILDKRRQ